MNKTAPLLMDFRASERAVVLAPAGALTAATADASREALDAALAATAAGRSVVLNCAAVRAFDADGLHLLIAFAERLAREGRAFRLAGLPPVMRRVVTMARLHERWDILDTVPEALQDLA